MIRLEKLPIPKVLADNEEQWTEEYVACITAGEKPPKALVRSYAHPSIKKVLEEDTHKKCAYCESKMLSTSYGDIEHILPKSKRPDLCFTWANLTLACEKCNRHHKNDYYNEEFPLVNPYVDDPDRYFVAAGAFMYPYQGDARAEITWKTLGLDRNGLVEERKERLDYVYTLLVGWKNAGPTDPRKAIWEEQLHLEYGKDKKYSFIVKGFLKLHDFPVQST